MRQRPSHGDAVGRWFPGGASGGRVAPAGGGGSNPNLLTFPEAFDNAAWVKTLGAVVTANPGDATHPTADRVDFTAGGRVAQNSATAAVSGLGVVTVTLAAGWQRSAVSASIDGLPYTFSVELLGGASAGFALQIAVQSAAGVIQAFLRDLGDGPVFLAYGAKLEQAGSFSGYP